MGGRHILRTPLNAILGFSDIMLRRSPSAEQRDHLYYIQQSAKTLGDLINDTLDLSKVETGQLQLDYQPCNVGLLLQELAQAMHMEIITNFKELLLTLKALTCELPKAAVVSKRPP